VLATVLFTDIVGSAEQLSSQGDSRWRHPLDVHDQLVDRSLSKYGGRRIKHPLPATGKCQATNDVSDNVGLMPEGTPGISPATILAAGRPASAAAVRIRSATHDW
jgi:class 3 adenylate cyclase